MFVRTSRCPEYRSSYLPFEDYHAQKKCANLTTEIVFNPSIAIRVYKTVVIPKALYGSELWSSMTPADLRKLEHSHRFCPKHMQGLLRRTSTNFTLSAINAVPMETVIDHKKLNFLGQLSYLPCSYMAKRFVNIRLTHFQHLDN